MVPGKGRRRYIDPALPDYRPKRRIGFPRASSIQPRHWTARTAGGGRCNREARSAPIGGWLSQLRYIYLPHSRWYLLRGSPVNARRFLLIATAQVPSNISSSNDHCTESTTAWNGANYPPAQAEAQASCPDSKFQSGPSRAAAGFTHGWSIAAPEQPDSPGWRRRRRQ